MSVRCTPAVAEFSAAVDRVVRDEKLLLSPEEMLGDTRQLLVDETRILAKVVHRVREAHLAEAATVVAGRPLRSWLVEELHLTTQRANQVMLLALHLHDFPTVREVFEAGRLTFEQVVAVLRGVLRLPAEVRVTAVGHLLEYAVDHLPSDIAKFADALLEGMGYDKESDAAREARMASRGIDLAETIDGIHSIRGSLTPDAAATVEEALRIAGQRAGDTDDRTARQRRHDAMAEIARAYLDQLESPPSFTGSPVGVLVVIPLEVLEQRATAAAAMLLPEMTRIGPETARRLACGAQLIPAVLGSRSEVLDIGRAGRDFTPAIRRAAYVEQRGRCAMHGCRRRVVECHHIEWWSKGGVTALDNAAWLCHYHHWLVHEGGWALRRNADRSFTFTSPEGVEHGRHPEAA